MLSAPVTKGLVLVSLFIATFLVSLLPIKLIRVAQHQHDVTRRNRYQAALSLLSCFAAGVFMATCLLDLLPDTKVKMDTALDKVGLVTSYPVSESLLAFGLFIILFVEQLVLELKQSGDAHEPLLSGAHSHDGVINDRRTSDILYEPESSPHVSRINSADECLREDLGHPSDESHFTTSSTELYKDPNSHSPLRSLMLLVALSLHSVFEGLAVGLQPTSALVLQIFAALSLHKMILAFSLGLNLVQTTLRIPTIVRCNLIFSLTSPIGIAIGIGVDEVSPNSFGSLFSQGVLQGLACGTFIYVVFFEILPHEFNSTEVHPNRLLKLLLLILGFVAVAMLLFLDPDVVTNKHIHGVSELTSIT